MFSRTVCVALAATLSVFSTSHPRAASFLEKNFWLSGPRYDRVMPTCDYPPALDHVIANFHTKEARFWNSALQIVGFENVHESAVCRGPRNPFPAASAAALQSSTMARNTLCISQSAKIPA